MPIDILSRIGGTTLLPLRRIVPVNGARVLLKLESENPTGSMKDRMALAIQAALLVQHAPAVVSDAFCASRLAAHAGQRNYGTLPRGVDCAAIIERATPRR